MLGQLCFVNCQLLVLGYVGIVTRKYAEGPYFVRLHRLVQKPLLQPFNVSAVSARCLGINKLCRTTTRCNLYNLYLFPVTWWCRQAFLVEAAVTTMLFIRLTTGTELHNNFNYYICIYKYFLPKYSLKVLYNIMVGCIVTQSV